MKLTDTKPIGSGPPAQGVKQTDARELAKARKHRTGHIFQRGNIYWIEYKVNGKRFRQSLETSDIDDARIKRTQIMAPYTVATEEEILQTVKQRIEQKSDEQDALDTRGLPRITIANAWQAYESSPNRPQAGPGTLRVYSQQYDRFQRWVKKAHPEVTELRYVSGRIADEYAADLNTAGISANTYNKHIRLLMLVFRVLEDMARIARNPWTKISRQKQVPQSRRELTSDELEKVIRSASGEMHTLFALGLYTGLRLGDCATLRWAEVDLRRGIILRIPNKTARSKGLPVRIPIHLVLASILGKASARVRGEYVLPEFAEKYLLSADLATDPIQRHFLNCGIDIHKKGTGHQIKRDKDGKPLGNGNGNIALRNTGKRAVVEVGFHSLRHTFVSLCREANTPLSVVEAIVGHSNPAMTRHYTHVGDVAASQAVAALPAFAGERSGTKEKTAGMDVGSDLSPRDKEIIAILEKSTAKTWAKDRDRVLHLIHAP